MTKKLFYLVLFLTVQHTCMAQVITGRVLSALDDKPVYRATVRQAGSNAGTTTDSLGRFNLSLSGQSAELIVSSLGYQTRKLTVNDASTNLLIRLIPEDQMLQEVIVSTGYQDIPRERAVGSFTTVNNETLNSRVSPDILSRLEGTTNGLNFTRLYAGVPDAQPSISVRGLSTFYANTEPLIVVDNFPYEGSIKNINPNDVESITVLKDASAASIWGARAGNGVIVITTKKGRSNQALKVQLNSVYTLAAKPDLFYNPAFMESPDFIAMEKLLFSRNFYGADETNSARPPISPVVELLIAQRDGKLSAAEVNARIGQMEHQDVRNDISRYLYRQGSNKQTSLNISGGGKDINFYLSAGYDQNDHQSRGNSYERLTLSSQNVFKPLKSLEVSAGLNFIQGKTLVNGLAMPDLSPGNGKTIYPYATLVNTDGSPAIVQRNYRTAYVAAAPGSGLLNWQYKPLEEIELSDNSRPNNEIRVNAGLKYNFLKVFHADFKYQYQQVGENSRNYQSPASFAVRDLLNRFTQTNGTNPIPYGGILNLSSTTLRSHSGRAQLNFNRDWRDHRLSAISGIEIRSIDNFRNASRLYGYDDEVLNAQLLIDYVTRFPTLPRSTASIPTGLTPLSNQVDRYESYYGNASYEYLKRYTLSASARQDASNLYGVETNQKRVPLWSAGLGWEISAEPFFKSRLLSFLKFRGTYGYNGNTEKSVTALATARYSSDPLTGLPVATVLSPGNPNLRWEKTGIVNLGLDFASSERRISGTVEVYRKYGKDLLGDLPLDPTTGFLTSYRVNYASLQTTGIDLQVHSRISKGIIQWDNDVLLSYVSDKVTKFDNSGLPVSSYFTGFSIPLRGKSLYRLYSYPDAALDPATGEPLVTINGSASKDYAGYVRNITADQLIDHGRQIPPYFGAVRNTFAYQGLALSVNVTWKAGYHFRRSSISYDALFNSWTGHRDFARRWQKPGDELTTVVPSVPATTNSNRDQIYRYSSSLVERGDHVRLQDVNLSYTPRSKLLGSYAGKIRLYLYASNLGILWRANKESLDPDYPMVQYPQPQTYSLGINANL